METFNGKTTFVMQVSINAKATPVNVSVTIDWDGYTIDDAMRDLLAGQSPRVKLQNQLRTNGIPAGNTVSINMREFMGNRRPLAVPMTDEQALEHLVQRSKVDSKIREALMARIDAILGEKE